MKLHPLGVLVGLLLLALGACTGFAKEQPDASVTAISVQSWGGAVVAPVAAPQRVTHLTLHHQGEFWLEGKPVPQYLQQLQRWSREVKRWSDIPYHYVVAPDGTVYAARDDAVAGDTNTEYDPQGHILVMLLGNFEVQTPTSAQWGGTVKLLAQLARRHGLDPAALATHRDYSAQTVCPGENLYRKFGDLRLQVAQQLNGAP